MGGRIFAFSDGPWLVLEFQDGPEVMCYDYATRAEAEEALLDDFRLGSTMALACAVDIEVEVSMCVKAKEAGDE